MKRNLSRFLARLAIAWPVFSYMLASSLVAQGASPLKAPQFVLEWGEKGSGPGEFHSPICIAISRKDEIFVADLNNARIQQFTVEGKWVGGFDLPIDTPPRKSCMIGGLAINSEGLLFVAFMIQHKIGVYTPQGKRVREWGKKGTADGEFHQPGGMVFPPDGTIAIADQCNHRVQVFSADGKFLRKWGGHGSKPGQFGGQEAAGSRFGGPHFLSLDSKGRFYTTEGVASRIQQFSAEGQPLSAWGDKTREPGAFGEYTFGSLKNTFGPIGVMADRQDRIWVSSLNDRVQCFTPEGKFLFRLDGPSEEDQFSKPHGMAVDSKGFFYIADAGNQRIVKFALPGR
jgi:sugar lactone lactonase YvrE